MRKPLWIAVLLAPLALPAPHGTKATIGLEAWAPRARPEEIRRRFQWSPEELLRWQGGESPLDLGRESYALYRPPVEDSSCRPGLLVWISPFADGSPPPSWMPVLDRHHLTWIGAANAGNTRPMLARLTLAVQSAESLVARGEVEPARVYVGGLSGGARCASELALVYPDLFAGGLYIIGCNYFRPLPDPAEPGSRWNAAFARPPQPLLRLARPHPYVFLTGSGDFNRGEVRATYEAYRSDGFGRAAYIEVPGMPHRSPSADWFEKGLEMLER